MKSLTTKITINRSLVKKGSNCSLPSFSIEGISKEQSDLLIDILINEYYNDKEGGENATE